MRIQHNIAAMNAYRNYTNNSSAVAKNLEKLSSGYKINRAGDDAAGLAISEKMRAQITGLQTAQKNAKDGISLVKTAEGALTEVHDMLNRMYELAEQSSNGVYDNEVDRANLQKEVSSLSKEIDRIADSVNFNGINLLDGSLDSEVKKTVGEATISGLEKFTKYMDRMGAAAPQVHKDATASSKTSFTIDFGNRTYKATKNDPKFSFQFGVGVNPDPTDNTAYDAYTTDNITLTGVLSGEEVSTEDLVNAVFAKMGDTINIKAAADSANNDVKAMEIEYKVSIGEDGKSLVFEMTDKGYQTALDAATKLATATGGSGNPADYLDAFRGNLLGGIYPNDTDLTRDGNMACTTSVITNGSPASGRQLAETFVAMNAADVKDGAGMMIGDQYYVWGASDKTVNGEYGANVHVVDIRDLADADGKLEVLAQATNSTVVNRNLTEAMTRLSVAAKDNGMFNVQVNKEGTGMGFLEKATNKSKADLTTADGVKAQIQKFKGIKANVETTPASGKALTLQIGDTADDFNQLKVSIKDMHAAAMGIGGIDISEQGNAATAMAKIKDAINYVSDVRGDLGATQNRLEHTINNLSVMGENIQDAESSIRDVDVADEMMAYTKNNILVQSAQAMLAQANQLPQGVLQLLQ